MPAAYRIMIVEDETESIAKMVAVVRWWVGRRRMTVAMVLRVG